MVTPLIAPALRLSPLIMDASISTIPVLDSTEPLPALNNSEFSNILIVASTASMLDPLFSKIL